MRKLDITGQRFGRLAAISLHHIDVGITKTGIRKSVTFWECKCDCGKTVVVILGNLRREGGTKSCGCLAADTARNLMRTDLTGKKIRELTVLRLNESTKRAKWICECSCGKTREFHSSQLLDPDGPRTCGHDTRGGLFRDKIERLIVDQGVICDVCSEFKPIEQFKRNNKRHPFRTVCSACDSAITHAKRIRKEFGISSDDYAKKFIEQDGKCEICDKPTEPGDKRLSVDHDHVSGEVRGLLCNSCNLGLGYFKDSPNSLAKAISYLAKYSQVEEASVKAVG